MFDYFGSIISYLAISIPIFSGKFGEDEDISSVVSAVSLRSHVMESLFIFLIMLIRLGYWIYFVNSFSSTLIFFVFSFIGACL